MDRQDSGREANAVRAATDGAPRDASPGLAHEAAWRAVLTRDRAWDGRLYYGVRTTGVYCRPSCPSRRPKPENVAFFTTPDRAEAAGYRACHRCHPRSTTGTPTERRIRRAIEYLESHLDERVTLERLGRAVGLSPFHLHRAFKMVVGLSPRGYQDAKRLGAMKARLREGGDVSRAVWRAGYGSVRGAYESAAAGLGMTPGRYRDGADGMTIRYSLHRTRFGRLLVAWTADGVCAVQLGDAPEPLVDALRSEFPAAVLTPERAPATGWVQAVLDYLEGTNPGLAVPVDLHGTNFQLRVWSALRQIPPGEVRSYREVAEAIGAPTASRAVARACATNRAALVVPCHRVVRSDGSPGGYRWGEERKRRLLEHEARMTGANTGDDLDA